MNRKTIQTIIIVLACLLFCLAGSGCYTSSYGCKGNSRIMTRVVKADTKHKCKWSLCPYKGVTLHNYKEAITAYTGEQEGTDAHAIDCLHILYPDADYDTLDAMLNED